MSALTRSWKLGATFVFPLPNFCAMATGLPGLEAFKKNAEPIPPPRV